MDRFGRAGGSKRSAYLAHVELKLRNRIDAKSRADLKQGRRRLFSLSGTIRHKMNTA